MSWIAKRPRYISVEGPIGVGKTTLSRMLAERFNARLVLEEFEDNPFLKEFYNDRNRVAFQTQIYFLMARFKQQEALHQAELFNQAMVSDYLFSKDRIFAYMNLSDAEVMLYEKIYDLVNPRVLQPDLVVYLKASTDVLMQRQLARGRQFEAGLNADYLAELTKRYSDFFQHYSAAPVLVVDTSEGDFVRHGQDFEQICQWIDEATDGIRYESLITGNAMAAH